MMDAVRHCTFSARLDCHYLLRLPETIDSRTLLVVALHGFSQTPEIMLPLTEKMFGPHHAVASVQGPNQFFTDARMQVGFGWNTSRHAAASIRLHHDMVQHVLNEAGREHGIPPERRILVGFSQPVALNYRFVATFPGEVRGVVGVCGGIPGDWESGPYQPVTAAALHIARRQDEYYPPAVTEQFASRLRLRIMDLEFHLIEGGHHFPSKGNEIVDGWLARILR
jgi:phospholipase/carboxylesterase